ncbi:hypothetical protein TURU_167707 [Turdus rufiventris]|nr:hypothetical protein TURU_167707 [Turdus rufiventris]
MSRRSFWQEIPRNVHPKPPVMQLKTTCSCPGTGCLGEETDPELGSKEHSDDNLSYSVKTRNGTYLLKLKKNKKLLSDDFKLYTYGENGKLHTTPSKNETHCYYHGTVEGIAGSTLALSTCDGLRGILYIGGKWYGMEPLNTSSTFEHVLYELEDVQGIPFHCGVLNGSLEHEVFVKQSVTHTFSSNRTSSRDRLLREKRAVLPQKSYVELFVVVDHNRFLLKNSDPAAVQKETVELINYVDGMYTALNIQIVLVGLEVWTDTNHISVMNGSAGDVLSRFVSWRQKDLLKRSRNDVGHLIIGSRNFSTCSADDFEAFILNGGGICLRNPPKTSNVYKEPVCGNNVVDNNEECDCGKPQFKVAGAECRAKQDACDLPEYCNGSTAYCPDDVYIMNGHPCSNSKAYCYYGVCQSFDSQCESIYGKGFECLDASYLGYSCDVKQKCNNNGVCNNNGNCHCNPGWAPPFCNQSGYGGSVDSGPTHTDTSLRDGLLIFFLLVLPVAILTAVAVFKRDAIRRKLCRKSRGQHRDNNGQEPKQGNRASNETGNNQLPGWKQSRRELLQCLEGFLRALLTGAPPAGPAQPGWQRFLGCCRRQGLLPAAEGEPGAASRPLLLLLDDNFYYQSMRYEVYQLARKYSLGFCQLFLECPLECCLQRNRLRSDPVPEQTIQLMARKIEMPDLRKNAWEQHSLILNSSECISEDDEQIMNLLATALENPERPNEEDTEQKEAARAICAASAVHQADQACRRVISQAMQDAKVEPLQWQISDLITAKSPVPQEQKFNRTSISRTEA